MSSIPFDPHGLLLRRDAVRLGYDDNWLARMVRSGLLKRVRHGAYVDPAIWSAATNARRHQLICTAVWQQYDDRIALSHTSGHVVRGGPDYGLDLSTVHVTNLFGRGDRTQAGITHHHGRVDVHDISRHQGYWITAGARTAVDTAALAPLVPAVCVLDWTLNQGHAIREELVAYAEDHMREWPDTIHLPRAVARCDPRSDSVGETRSRLLLEDLGFSPEPHWRVRHPSRQLAGIVDMVLLQQGVMVEFDGKVKYGRLLKPGQTISDVIEAERRREILLQELTGLEMMRLIWSDLDRPKSIEARLHRLAAQQRSPRWA